MASGYMFSHYWPGDGVEGETPVTDLTYTYPYWFDPSTLGSLGTPPHLPRRIRKRILGWWVKNVKRRLPLRLVVLYNLLKLVFSPKFTQAYEIVKAVAHDPSSRDLKYWGHINRLAVSNPKWGENAFRGMSARLRMGTGDLTDYAVLVELAYLGLKRRGR